jgi:hypothetical protein
MRTLLLLFIGLMLSFAPSTNAQKSLAEITGEQTSLYNAACILNGIEPGTIGMTEGRVLMAKYAESIGLNYKLYLKNGGNNLHILHFVPTTATETTTEPSVNEVNADSTINLGTDIEVIKTTEVLAPSTVDTITIATIDTIFLTEVNIDTIYSVDTVVEEKELFCDCSGKTAAELNQYYTEVLAKRRATKDKELKDRYGFCAYQIRRFKKYIERKERLARRTEQHTEIEETSGRDYSFKEVLPDYDIGDKKLTAVAPPKKPKPVRVRKLGKGHAKSKNTNIWSKIFPFRGC